MREKRTIRVLLVILLLLVAAAGGLMLARPYIIERQRLNAEAALIHQIENGQIQIEIGDIPEMDGEQFTDLEDLGEDYETPEESETEPKVVTGYGLLEIPAIELKMPLVQGADSYSLRAAAGWWPESATMGSAGNCVIFGHRMVTYGRHFNRLDELKEGDEVCLTNTDGKSFTYIVTGSEVITPSVLVDTLYEHNEGFGVTLVTCTPTGVGSHRLLVYAQLENPGSVEE